MEELVKKIALERMGEPLVAKLGQNEAYQESREQYHTLLEHLKEKTDGSQKERDLLLKLDEAVGDYSGEYGETAYAIGFHDGLDVGLEHGNHVSMDHIPKIPAALSVEDVTNLIYIYDAYKSLNRFLLGNEMSLGFEEGIIGAMGRIYKILENHMPSGGDDGELSEGERILADMSIKPEVRARMLFAG